MCSDPEIKILKCVTCRSAGAHGGEGGIPAGESGGRSQLPQCL